jgi:hypothetical protein
LPPGQRNRSSSICCDDPFQAQFTIRAAAPDPAQWVRQLSENLRPVANICVKKVSL